MDKPQSLPVRRMTRRFYLNALLEAYRLLQVRRQADFRARAELLLENVRPAIDEIRRRRKGTGERFNVFSALQLDRREVYHSRFIAYLFDPSSRHDQGAVFLNCFLQFIGHPTVTQDEEKQVTVSAELAIARGVASPDLLLSVEAKGRMDIFIKTPHSAVVIENKIDAGEQLDQVKRYCAWLKGQSGKTALIYLTPTGVEAQSGKANSCISYSELARLLRESLTRISKQAVSLHEVIGQYAQLCHAVSKGEDMMEKIDGETEKLLTDENNLATALELADVVVPLKRGIKERFIANLVTNLRERLRENGLSDIWKVQQSLAKFSLDITHSMHKELKFSVETLFSDGFWYGWYHPGGKDAVGGVEESGPYTDWQPQKGYLRWRKPETWVHDDNGMVLAVNRDNQDEQHPLAIELAEMLWDEFDAYHEKVQSLLVAALTSMTRGIK